MAVHTGTVITEHRFRHKGCSFTETVRNVVNHIFVDLNFVCFFGHGIEAGCHFVLTSSCNFVVMSFNNQAHLFHYQTHSGAQVLCGVHWWNREVTTFNSRTVTFVTAFVFGGGVPCAFDIIDSNVGTGNRAAEAYVVEQEELWLWPEQNGVCDACCAQVFFSAFCDGARVAIVALHGARLEDIATDDQSRFFVERVNDSGRGVRHQYHVRFVNAFPATNRGAIKHLAFFKEVSIYLMSWDRDVLLFTFSVGEAQINKLDFVLVQHRQNVFSGHT